MPSGPNPILTSANAQLPVTNLTAAGSTSAAPIAALSGIPLTTADGTATGQIVVATRTVGAIPLPIQTAFNSVPALATSNGSIPVGVISWGFTVVSGTVTINGGATLPIGASFSGGGIANYFLEVAIPYTITAGSALVTWDLPA